MAPTEQDAFAQLEEELRRHGGEAALELLIRRFRLERNFPLLFRARTMQARVRCGLPPIETDADEIPPQQRAAYEAALQRAARETGELALEAGDISGAWPFFKALGETAPVAEAIEHFGGEQNLDSVIEIAFQEGVNIRKGFELILEHRGICSALTWYPAIRDEETRRKCLGLLVRTLYGELAESLRETITGVEEAPPGTDRVAELIAGRRWLFEGKSYYVDSTHLTALLRFTPELEDPGMLRMAAELADYGQALDPMYHFRGDPPFENPYVDCSFYLHALLGDDVESGVAHFRGKGGRGSLAAEALVDLLMRLGRPKEALEAAIALLPDSPSVLQLCQMAGDFATLRAVARERRDLLGFAAAILQE